MWNEYTLSYIKKNKATSISIMVSAFIAATLISFVCGLFYNMWIDEIKRLIKEDGNWHARMMIQLSDSEIQTVNNFANVKKVEILPRDGLESMVEVYFEHPSKTYQDMPKIAKKLGVPDDKIEYHNLLLSKYFIFSPQEKKDPPLLLIFYLFVMLLTCISLILIIKNAFYFSMNTRVHQFGLLQSIGATPGQIRFALLQESAALCALPILIGNLGGIVLCIGFLQFANRITARLQLSSASFHYHIAVFLITLVSTSVTVLFSAWLSARRLSKTCPLRSIQGGGKERVVKVKKFYILSAILGIEGELARKSLYTRRKAFRTALWSLTLSFFVFGTFLNFMTLSEISTKHTYFERYKDSWDIMIELNDYRLRDNRESEKEGLIRKLRNTQGVSSCIAYQKCTAYTRIDKLAMSDEFKRMEGEKALQKVEQIKDLEEYLVKVPLIILDQDSYLKYRNEVIALDGGEINQSVITLNTIWDTKNSSYRNKEYLPFLKESNNNIVTLYTDQSLSEKAGILTISAYTSKAPKLREEYPNFSLVQMISENVYQSFEDKLPPEGNKLFINIRTTSDQNIEEVYEKIGNMLYGEYEYTIENRVDKEQVSSLIYSGYKKLLGALCMLLALIGIANVFANTLGNLYQRRREFARYQSVGLTPGGVNKVLFAEAFIVGIKPIVLCIPLHIAFVIFAVHASGIKKSEFLEHAPILPITLFALMIMVLVGIFYYIGGRQITKCNMVDALKDDTQQ